MYLGDFTPAKTITGKFNTHKADGTPITLAGTPALSVYKDSTTESTTGVTLSVDYDSRTGMHRFSIDTSSDGTFYSAGNNFEVVITTGTVDSISVVGTVVGSFSLSNRSALRPATADRTLVVDSAGLADANAVKLGPSGSGTAQTARDLGAINVTNLNTLSGHDPGATLGTSTLTQAQVTGGAYALNSSSFAFNAALDLTSTMKTSVTTAATAATPTAAAVTGNVGGNVTGSVGSLAAQAKADVNAECDTALVDAKAGYAVAIEAAILDEGDATALLAAIAAKVEEFLVNEGDATATLAAIATAVWGNGTRTLTSAANITSTGGTTVPQTGDAYAVVNSGTFGNAAIKTDTAAVKAKTDNLPSDPADASDVASAFSTVNSTLATIAAYVDTEVAAIKAKTDNLPASPAAVGSAMTLTSAYDAAKTAAQAGDQMNLADAAITEAKISTPSEAAGRPTGILGMIRRIFEWRSNKRVRTRTTGELVLRNAADSATLETQTQSTSGGTGSEVDTQTKGV